MGAALGLVLFGPPEASGICAQLPPELPQMTPLPKSIILFWNVVAA